jgi:hypothetical protein
MHRREFSLSIALSVGINSGLAIIIAEPQYNGPATTIIIKIVIIVITAEPTNLPLMGLIISGWTTNLNSNERGDRE